MWELHKRPPSKQTEMPEPTKTPSNPSKPTAAPEPRKDGRPPHGEAPQGQYWRWNEKRAAYMGKGELLQLAGYYVAVAEAQGVDPLALLQSYRTLKAYRR